MNIEQTAKVCHQANKAYCEANQDFSQSNWEDADDNIKASAIKGVQYFIDNPGSNMPADMHESWTEAKLADGWVYGETKDLKTKTHPNLVEYEELNVVERKKDYLFCAICSTCMAEDVLDVLDDNEEEDEDNE